MVTSMQKTMDPSRDRSKTSNILFSPQKNRAVLDTITTRFLMLFVIVMVIPLFSLIIFTQSLLQNHLERSTVNTIRHSEYALDGKLNAVYQDYQAGFSTFSETNSSDFMLLCRLGSDKLCFKLDLDQDKVIYPDKSLPLREFFARFPDFQNLVHQGNMTHVGFYGMYYDQLVIFNAYRSTINKNHWVVIGNPLNTAFILGLYRENPALETGTWILKEPFHPKNPKWLARGPSETSDFFPTVKQELLTTLYQRTFSRQETVDIQGTLFRISEKPLYNLANEKIARIVTLLPLSKQKDLLSTYYLGIYIIVVAGLVFSVFVAILASRTITQPLLKLVDQVISLSRFRDLSQRVTIQGVHEINQLAFAFNHMLEKLQQEHKMKDEFVATLTHDLKVPLLAEKQTLDYMQRGTYGELTEAQHEVIQTLNSSNQSNLDLVNGILEVYRYESGQMRLMFESVVLDRLLEETVNRLRPLAEQKQIDLTVDNPVPSDRPLVIWADGAEIKRVLVNLISNALANTPKCGKVHCRIFDRVAWQSELVHRVTDYRYSSLNRPLEMTDRILVSIQDSGIGFSHEDIPYLFTQFAANRGRNPMSIGLGLYNCYQVVHAHNGAIWIETTEGEGSAVSFLLPVTEHPSKERRKQGDRRFYL